MPSPKMRMHDPPVFVSANPARQYNHDDRTRTAMGAAIHWFPAYNDGTKGDAMSVGFGEVSRVDNNRAVGGGPASWAAPETTNRVLWEEKFIGPTPLGSNPIAQLEFKSERTQREQANGINAGGMVPPPAAHASALAPAPADEPKPWQKGGKSSKYFDPVTGKLGPPFAPPTSTMTRPHPFMKQ